MDERSPSTTPRALVLRQTRDLSRSGDRRRTVASARGQWLPPEGVMPDDARAVIAAGTSLRDRLLMRCMWATGGRVSEVLALRPMDVHADALVLVNLKHPRRLVKRVYLAQADLDLPGALLLFARDYGIGDQELVFRSRTVGPDGGPRAITRSQAWRIVKDASRRAGVLVLALRPSVDGERGDPAPITPHVFRHARVRATLRATRNLAVVQQQAGWSRPIWAYLTAGDAEVAAAMRDVRD